MEYQSKTMLNIKTELTESGWREWCSSGGCTHSI